MGTANPPDWVKPAMVLDETSRKARPVLRGDSGQRAEKDQPRNLGDPAGQGGNTQTGSGINNVNAPCSGVGGTHSSGEAGNDRGAKGSHCRQASARNSASRLSESSTTEPFWEEMGEARVLTEKVTELRRKLGCKAKEEPKFRFYSLYGLMLREDVLEAAWSQVRKNKGGSGIDGITIKMVEANGVNGFLSEIREDLTQKRYKPKPVKRVYIPKANGKLRPLGIPCIRDRVVQMAALLILEPILARALPSGLWPRRALHAALFASQMVEADFLDCSYGFRPGRNAHQALEKIRSHIKQGFKAVYDADLSSYFDTIPHDKLIKCLETRIADRSMLKLIRSWLKAPVVEPPEKPGGEPKVHRPKCGSPQGGVISPLLSNLYLHMFDKLFHRQGGPAIFANAKIVRYADDFVILAKYQGSRIKEWVEETLEGRFKLKVNRDKTRIVDLNNEGVSLDFLGFTFRFCRDKYGRYKTYLNVEPSKKSLEKERDKLREMTSKKVCFKPIPELIEEINRHLTGWANYFKFGYASVAFRKTNWFTSNRLLKHLCRRSQRPFKIPKGVTCYAHFTKLGLKRI